MNPLPNAERSTRSPLFIFPCSIASLKAMGIEAAVVFPYFWILLKTFSFGNPNFSLYKLSNSQVRPVRNKHIKIFNRLSGFVQSFHHGFGESCYRVLEYEVSIHDRIYFFVRYIFRIFFSFCPPSEF